MTTMMLMMRTIGTTMMMTISYADIVLRWWTFFALMILIFIVAFLYDVLAMLGHWLTNRAHDLVEQEVGPRPGPCPFHRR